MAQASAHADPAERRVLEGAMLAQTRRNAGVWPLNEAHGGSIFLTVSLLSEGDTDGDFLPPASVASPGKSTLVSMVKLTLL
ncbi:unnamed protein product [Lota lota]